MIKSYIVVGRGGALVESKPVNRREGRGLELRSTAATQGPFRKSFTHSCLWRFGVNLRHSIRAVSGALLSSSGLNEALQKYSE